MEHLEGLALDILEQMVAAIIKPSGPAPYATDARGLSPVKYTRYGRLEVTISDRSKEGLNESQRILRYPVGGNRTSSKHIAQLLRIMSYAHRALEQGVPLTKRDIYYRDVTLFRSQKIVDRRPLYNRDRTDLNIRATSKGLICGSCLVIRLMAGEESLRLNDHEGTLIPAGEDVGQLEVENRVAWVLVVEKEAIFQTLCQLNFTKHPALPGPGLIVTGKGYPDVATRRLVKMLSDKLPQRIPIVALVDADAYGLDILSVFKYGSHSLRHDNENLAAHRVEWLGIKTSELSEFKIDPNLLIPITKYDERKARKMLCRPPENLPIEWRCFILTYLGGCTTHHVNAQECSHAYFKDKTQGRNRGLFEH
ncbi:DNA topoisomerase IV alpha subunit [Pisolithus sp. B1]|nr:DNA topoisomerase IV alpha subunit [Pisolithus sp. B1]